MCAFGHGYLKVSLIGLLRVGYDFIVNPNVQISVASVKGRQILNVFLNIGMNQSA